MSTFVLWCLVHGLAVLALDEQLPPELRRSVPLDRLAEHTTQLVLEGLGP